MIDYNIEITVDTNDADYNTKVSTISEEDLDKIKSLIDEIKKQTQKNKWVHNYPNGEYCDETPQDIYPNISEEIHELFNDYCPYCEYGFHTIESIYIYPLFNKTKLL